MRTTLSNSVTIYIMLAISCSTKTPFCILIRDMRNSAGLFVFLGEVKTLKRAVIYLLRTM